MRTIESIERAVEPPQKDEQDVDDIHTRAQTPAVQADEDAP
jgi:hypothetical protein